MWLEHIEGFRGLLTADERFAERVHLFTVPKNPDGTPFIGAYFVLFDGNRDAETHRYAAAPSTDDRVTARYTVRAVAPDATAVLDLLGTACGIVLGKAPDVEGRVVFDVVSLLPGGEPVRRDATTDPPLFFAEDDYSFSTDPEIVPFA